MSRKEVLAYKTSCHHDIRALQRLALNVLVERNVSSHSHQEQMLEYGNLIRITSPNVDLNRANIEVIYIKSILITMNI